MKEKFPPPLTIKKHMLFLIGGITILLITGAYAYISFEEKSIRDEKCQDLKAIAQLKINEITQWHKERIANAQVISDEPFFVRGISRWLENKQNQSLKKDIIERLMLTKKEYGYAEIFLTSPKGESLLPVAPLITALDPLTSLKIVEAVKHRQVALTDFYFCYLHKEIHYDIVAPIVDDRNNSIATLVFRIHPSDYLYPLIQSWPTFSKTSETLLLRKDGDSVLFLNELRHIKNTPLTYRISLSEKNVPEVQAALGYRGIFEGKDYSGTEVLSYVSQVPDTQWFLVAKSDKSEIFAELYYRATAISCFTLILILLCGTGAVLIYRSHQNNIYMQLFRKYRELHEHQEEFKTMLYSIGDGVITTDREGIIQLINPIAEKLTGWSEADAKWMPIERVFTIINEDTLVKAENPVVRVLKEGIIIGLANQTLLISKKGKETPITDSGAPIKNESGEITGVVLVFRTQTLERAAQKALLESEENFRNLFENSPLGQSMAAVDGPVHVNKSFSRILGYSETEFKTKEWIDITHPDDIRKTSGIVQSLLESKISQAQFEKRYIHKDGSIVWTDVSIYLQRDNKGKPKFFMTTINDITERKLALEELQRSEERFRKIFEEGSVGMVLTSRDLKIFSANPAFCRMLGYTLEEMNTKTFLDVTHPEHRAIDKENVDKMWRGEIDYYRTEKRYITKDGDIRWGSLSASLIRKQEGYPLCALAMVEDITERKRAEEALRENEKRSQTILNNSPDTIYSIDLTTGKPTFLNREEFCGYTLQELEAPDFIISEVHPDDLGMVKESWQQIKKQVQFKPIEYRLRRKGNGFEWIEQRKTVLSINPDGSPRQLIVTLSVVTERKQAEMGLRRALEEKEVLLHEVHHRVKNNLQAIISLMNMRSTDVKDAETLVFLKELESQARTMALVYEQLYQSENLARVAMRPYIENLCSNVIEGFGGDRPIEKSVELEDLSFDVSYAIPCGLIINELLTNSLKHAFPKDFTRKNKVTIRMNVDRDVCTLTVADIGIGMPSGFDWRTSKSIGLRLVNLWATHQLGGTLEVDNEGGTMFIVKFKIQKEKE